MTPKTFNAIRHGKQLSINDTAAYLRVDSRSVRRYEDGSRPISGPVAKLMEQLQAINGKGE